MELCDKGSLSSLLACQGNGKPSIFRVASVEDIKDLALESDGDKAPKTFGGSPLNPDEPLRGCRQMTMRVSCELRTEDSHFVS